MSSDRNQLELPGKIEAYLAALSKLYAKEEKSRLQEIITNGAPTIHEQWSYDSWDDGGYGHALTLTIPEDLFLEITNDKAKLQARICSDINALKTVRSEHIDEVFIEMETSEHDGWRESSGLLRPRSTSVSIPPQSLTRIWGTGHVRVFLSHKAKHKVQTSQLKAWLGICGLACFVAHEDIEPTEEWQREIEYALQSMDALVALITEDFHQSNWTDQELGIALGRGVPVIAVCLGKDPYGLIGKNQGLRGCNWKDLGGMAAKIYALLHKNLADQSRLFEAALAAYAASTTFADSAWKVSNVLSTFETLTCAQADRIVRALRDNRQNRLSFVGRASLIPLLNKWTGCKWEVDKDKDDVREVKETPIPDDDIPF